MQKKHEEENINETSFVFSDLSDDITFAKTIFFILNQLPVTIVSVFVCAFIRSINKDSGIFINRRLILQGEAGDNRGRE